MVMREYGQATQEYLQVHTKTNSSTEGSKKDITGRVFILTETWGKISVRIPLYHDQR